MEMLELFRGDVIVVTTRFDKEHNQFTEYNLEFAFLEYGTAVYWDSGPCLIVEQDDVDGWTRFPMYIDEEKDKIEKKHNLLII